VIFSERLHGNRVPSGSEYFKEGEWQESTRTRKPTSKSKTTERAMAVKFLPEGKGCYPIEERHKRGVNGAGP
jgi:hypothetical protein